MAFCSAVTLCFAAICAVISAALVAIAFSTDNWQVVSVNRNNIQVRRAAIQLVCIGTVIKPGTDTLVGSYKAQGLPPGPMLKTSLTARAIVHSWKTIVT